MDLQTCCLINGPLVILNIVANAFYTFCMVCPLREEGIKQPLKLLLGSLVCCILTYQMSTIVLRFSQLIADSLSFYLASFVAFFYTLSTIMNCSVWLNFYYYTQIVPSQRAVFIWLKKNIKPFIYCIWLVERILGLVDIGITIADFFGYNFPIYNDTIYFEKSESELQRNLRVAITWIGNVHFIICLCVMVMASGSTVVYLCGHMRRMVAHGQPFSCPHFRSQVRVTVTGILQGVLYVFCAAWRMYCLISPTLHSSYIYYTILNIYMACTTFCLGAGQAVFRQRVADIWHRAAQLCKVSKVQQPEQGG